MKRALSSLLHLAILAGALCGSVADDFPAPYNTELEKSKPMTADETARTAELPEGFHLEVFASEPEVQQPISMCFDDTGRLWVAECYTFAEVPMRWDLKLQDRIIVLEDNNGDGKSDARTVFWDKGKRLTSIAHARGGVWALCAPQLLFIPDKNGDLIPDSEPVVVLDGFDAETIGHNIANGLKWGPDGWLYGRHGITATSLVAPPGTPENQRTALNCSIWRYHPETQAFEVFCHGGTNPWGLDWDKNGQLFYTNTVIGHLWHAIPGAYYERMFGAHLNTHAYEVIPHTADHYHWDRGNEKWSDIRKGITDTTATLGGGHAHMGCLIYEGGVWPEAYHGKLFTNNLHGRRVNMDILEREGCGFVGLHGKDFLMMKDPWFRGLDLLTGPDGQVWINDWSDTGECHDNDGIHRTSGRIYRIVYDGPDKGTPTPDRPEWLTSRGGKTFSKENFDTLFASDNEGQRAMAVRWLAEDHPTAASTLEKLKGLAESDLSGLVHLELAAALQKLPKPGRFDLATLLCAKSEEAGDRQQSLMIWYGISDAVPEHPDKAAALAIISKLPTVTRLISRRLTENLEKAPEAVNQLLTSALGTPGKSIREAVLLGMSEALQGWIKAPKPTVWDAVVKDAAGAGSDKTKTLIRELSVVFGDGRARDELLAIAGNADADPGARRAALANLLRQPTDDLLPLLKNWMNDKVISREAILGLASYEEAGISPRILAHWRSNPQNRSAVIDTLVSRASYAFDLLDAVKNGVIPRDAISPFQARQIQTLGNEKLNDQLRQLWGEVRETPEATRTEISQWKSTLSKGVIAASDPVKGKIIFTQSCSACHKLYGEGGALGPDLTGSDRHNIDYLLGNIVNPNEVVPADYRLSIFTLKDGRILSGVVPEENERSITIQSPVERIVIDLNTVTKRETMPISLMPEGLLRTMGEASVRDLVAYLMTSGPVTGK